MIKFVLFCFALHKFQYQSSKVMFSPAKRPFQTFGNELNKVSIETDKKTIAVWACSDMHADTQRNQDWVRSKCSGTNDPDVFSVFILPGDIGTEIDRLSEIFDILTKNYDAVSYCIGNHEAWRRGTAAGGSPLSPEKRTPTTDREAKNSIEKLIEVVQCAKSKGVYVGPLRITSSLQKSSVSIFPLQSWYHTDFDKEPDLNDREFLDVQKVMPFERRWGDFNQCIWPGIDHERFASIVTDDPSLAIQFADLNENYLPPGSKKASPLKKIGNNKNLAFDEFGQVIFDAGENVNYGLNLGGFDTSPQKKKITQEEFDELFRTFKENNLNNLESSEKNFNSTERSPSNNETEETIISFSHFVPRQELMPEKRFLLEPHLMKVKLKLKLNFIFACFSSFSFLFSFLPPSSSIAGDWQ
jgi:hypothetical protein